MRKGEGLGVDRVAGDGEGRVDLGEELVAERLRRLQ